MVAQGSDLDPFCKLAEAVWKHSSPSEDKKKEVEVVCNLGDVL